MVAREYLVISHSNCFSFSLSCLFSFPRLVFWEIDAYPKLAKKLHHLVENGWIEIYYHIYSRFFDGSR